MGDGPARWVRVPALRPALGTALAVCLALAVATAAAGRTLIGTEGADRLVGTRGPDALYGYGGRDRLEGRGGDDLLHGGEDADRLSGGRGADRLAAHGDEATDALSCGRGRDIVNAELRDAVAADCEVVSRQLSRDPYRNPESQHETQVEPDTFAFGSTMVTVFQSGRFADGGASNIGFAVTRDGGRSWRSGFLPALSVYANPAGSPDRVSDPVVTYDAVHGYWLVASLAVASDGDYLLVSRSRDGVSWARPVVAAAPAARGESYDKEWIACDNWGSSPYRGRCYLSYLDLQSGNIATKTSSDGGLTWSAPATVPPGALPRAIIINGAQPVVRPDGALVVVFTAFAAFADADANHIAAARSTDGGATFEPAIRVAQLAHAEVAGMRAPPFPSVEVDGGGTIYAAWHDARFRREAWANDIVIATSQDGVSWTAPARVPIGTLGSDVDYFTPGLAVDPATAGARARLTVAFHSRPPCNPCRGVDVHVISSQDGGVTWGRRDRLNVDTMPLSWIADTGLGRMLGDYISTSFVAGRAIPVFALASRPVGEEGFRQAIFALTTRR